MTFPVSPIHFDAVPGLFLGETSWTAVDAGLQGPDQYLQAVMAPPLQTGSLALFAFGPPPIFGGTSTRPDPADVIVEVLKGIHGESGLRKILAILLNATTPIEHRILMWRFPWLVDNEDRPLSLKEIGSKYNLTPERIRRLQDGALFKLMKIAQEMYQGEREVPEDLIGVARLPLFLEPWWRAKEANRQSGSRRLKEALMEVMAAQKTEKITEPILQIAINACRVRASKAKARDLLNRWNEAFDEASKMFQGIEWADLRASLVAGMSYRARFPREKAREVAQRYLEAERLPDRSKAERERFLRMATNEACDILRGHDRRQDRADIEEFGYTRWETRSKSTMDIDGLDEIAYRIALKSWVYRTFRPFPMARNWRKVYLASHPRFEGRDRADEIAKEIADAVCNLKEFHQIAELLIEGWYEPFARKV